MRFLVQRVNSAEVAVDGKVIGSIEKGFLVFIGVADGDTTEIADKLIKKLIGLRIFADAEGKTNLALGDVSGELLLVSQFTLYADCRKGNRPSFVKSGSPEAAEQMYDYIIGQCRTLSAAKVETGSFGADMKVSLVNDGPFTVMLDSNEICR